jgi:protein TonB
MPTDLLPTRAEASAEKLSQGFALALTLHLIAIGALLAAAWVGHNSHHWGESDPTAGSVQASMVSSLPLPSRQRYLDNSVLASEHTSPAPTPTQPAPNPKTAVPKETAPTPKPNDILIPSKKNPKPTADTRTTPSPSSRTPAPSAPTPKATTGDSPGIQIPQSITQLKNGTASITVDDRAFGDRYAYYIRLISQKIAESKAQGDPDGPETRGRKTIIRFIITRDGTPTNIAVFTPSGSPALDTSTLRAIQRIDSFGPLPSGNQLPIRFEYDSK